MPPLPSQPDFLDDAADDWVSPAQLRALASGDAASVWLELYGKDYSFPSDDSPFLSFVSRKKAEFVKSLLAEWGMATLEPICAEWGDERKTDAYRETLRRMEAGEPVLRRGALRLESERMVVSPELIVRSDWLASVWEGFSPDAPADHYVPVDLLFKTDKPDAEDLMRVRWSALLLGRLQSLPLRTGFVRTRGGWHAADLGNPKKSIAEAEAELLEEARRLAERYRELRFEFDPLSFKFKECLSDPVKAARGDCWPGLCPKIRMSGGDSGRWATSLDAIAERVRLPRIYYLGSARIAQLGEIGFPTDYCGYVSLDTLESTPPDGIDWTKIKGIGKTIAPRIEAFHRANHEKRPVFPAGYAPPETKPLEAFLDIETFNNMNADFDGGKPGGCPMIFMIGVGWEESGEWRFEPLVAPSETPEGEAALLDAFRGWLEARGFDDDPTRCALYHWSPDVKKRLSESGFDGAPFVDVNQHVIEGRIVPPGAWSFKIKEYVAAIGRLNPALAVRWPETLEEGQSAMLKGWEAYRHDDPLQTEEMHDLIAYLDCDCRAIREILRWLRSLSAA